MATCESRLTAETVESPLPGDWHGGFGERSGETGRWQHRNRAPGRLNNLARGSGWAADMLCRLISLVMSAVTVSG